MRPVVITRVQSAKLHITSRLNCVTSELSVIESYFQTDRETGLAATAIAAMQLTPPGRSVSAGTQPQGEQMAQADGTTTAGAGAAW